MSLRHENLTPEELALQRDLDRSWEGAQKALADPLFRAYLGQSIARLNSSPSTKPLSKDEFLVRTDAAAPAAIGRWLARQGR